ncbi:sensor histidine kinase [Nonomuraea sp. SYSU D8015]|uniref:sensor histidine kinase n=1 Tax=Nonomuraea sp. SYSU D8015 TaxID=2593644 RepID=UPI001660D800|nr:histidine kinase [Nonomuraea sp. SYSU D8015]
MERPEWVTDVWLGLMLCAMAAGGLVTGHAWRVTWPLLGAVLLSAVALVARAVWPRASLAVATVGALMAMPADLDTSAADALLGAALLIAGGLRWRHARPGRAFLTGSWRRALAAILPMTVVVVAVPADLKESAGAAMALAGYAAAGSSSRLVALVSGVGAAAAIAGGSMIVAPEAWTGQDTPVPLIAAVLVGAAAGDAARSRRQLLAAWQDRARHGAVQERLRIAREVHDLVAHHIAVISMQAGVAGHSLHREPEAAAKAIGHVQAASRTALDQLGTLLSVLRDGEPPPVEPVAGLADLPRMLDRFAAVGLRVDHTDMPHDLPTTVDLSAYWVIHEALTNAHKHGDGHACLRVWTEGGTLGIEVRNRIAAAREPSSGHGLTGVTERVHALGGSLTAGPDRHDEFVLRGSLPIRADAELVAEGTGAAG